VAVPQRKYNLYIGYVKELDDKLKNKLSSSGLNSKTIDMQSLPIDKQFIKITEHQITANVHYPRNGSSGKSVQQTITVTNPNESTIVMCRSANVVLLEAGYNGDISLPIICATQIVESQVEKQGQDRVLTLICSDAHRVKREISISKTYGASLTYKDVIDDLLTQFITYGVPSVADLSGLADRQLGRAKVFSDGLAEALTNVCNSVGYRWFLSAGIIYVEPKVKPSVEVMKRSIRVLPENVKQQIREVKQTINRSPKEKIQERGISIVLNLNGNFSAGEVVDVTFGEFEGSYFIRDVKHSLDFEGSQWDTIVECFK